MVFEQLFLVGLAVIAGYFVFTGGRQLTTVFHILRNDPLPIRELHGHRGPVEIEGQATEGEGGTVTAPFTGSSCLAYTYEVEERNGKSWRTLDEGMGGTDFVVDDGTGRVRVDPTGAEVHLESHSVGVPAGSELPDRLAAYVDSTAAVDPPDKSVDLLLTEVTVGKQQRFTERRLDGGETVYVYGEASRGPATDWGSSLVDALIGTGDRTPVFVISDTDERGTAWRIARGSVLELGFGLVLFVAVVGTLFDGSF
jgi:hypothetical protein